MTNYSIDGNDEAVSEIVRCECGACTGERCLWVGETAKTVVVEFMPVSARASHIKAGNAGTWPANGAMRILVERSCAERLLESEGEWAEIIEAPVRGAPCVDGSRARGKGR